MNIVTFTYLLITLTLLGMVVFIALYFIRAGYGMFRNAHWGPSVPNKTGWILMEAPVFFVMLFLWWNSERRTELVPFVFLLLFELHYFQRSFVFPFLIKGKNRMPIAIMSMGILFNLVNGYIQGEWIFYLAPGGMYRTEWLSSPQFITGTVVFLAGMAVNWHSDRIIRTLRKPGDTKHYLPNKGFYKYVTSANYLGEIVEWTGFAILTCSPAAVVFAWWTFANLVPRAHAIRKRYITEFGMEAQKKKRVFPFIY